MMQNLTLPTSQTLALGAMDANKNNANLDKANLAQPNISFEKMLSRQVKAHKEATQQKSEMKKTAQLPQGQSNIAHSHQVKSKSIQNQKVSEGLVEENVSIEQMVGKAKALLATDESNLKASVDARSDMMNVDSLIANPEGLPALAIASNFTQVNNNLSQNNTVHDSLMSTKDNTIATSLPVLTAMPAKNMTENLSMSTAGAKGELQPNFEGSEANLPQDKLLWASVSVAKPDQANALENVNVALNAPKDLTTKIAENSNFSDIANGLNVAAIQQSQAPQSQTPQSTSILSAHQLGSSNQIHAYPGKTGWDQAISQKIVWMAGAAEQTATLSLNPPDLGPLQVVINVRNDMADTTFISNNAEVRQALQDGIANLREKMAESGIQLGQANVNSGGRPQQEFQQNMLNQQSSSVSSSDAITSIDTTVKKANASRINIGLVDTFA